MRPLQDHVQRIDSIDLSIPTELLFITDKSKYEKMSVMDGELMSQSLTDRGYSGLNGISVGYGDGGNTSVKLSAKVLGNQYVKGINKNNIEGVLETVKKYGYLDFDSTEVLHQSKVRRIDIFKNMKVDKVEDYVNTLKFTNRDRNKIETTTNWGSQSVVFRRKVSSYKERLICYDKHLELLRYKNKGFLNQFDKTKILNDCMGVLRFETNTGGKGSFKKVRERFNVDTNFLYDVLHSTENVIWNIYRRMTHGANNQELINLNKKEDWMKLNELKNWNKCQKDIGLRSIICMFDGDYQKVRDLCKSMYDSRTNPSSQIKRIRQMCRDYNSWKLSSQVIDKNSFEKNLMEIDNFLKVS